MNFQSVQSKQMLFFVGLVAVLISAYVVLDFGKRGESRFTLERITKRWVESVLGMHKEYVYFVRDVAVWVRERVKQKEVRARISEA